MKDIAIYGAGGFGKEVACLIGSINKVKPQYRLIGFFDDGKPKGAQISHFGKVLGGIDELNGWSDKICIAIAIGSPKAASTIHRGIINQHVTFPNLIHPSFYVNDPETFSIGQGNIIQRNCAVTCDVTIGDFNVLNGSVALGHDVTVGNHNVFMPATRISGEVKIGNNNLFGVGAIVVQQLHIGDNVNLSPSSVLLTKPKDGGIYIGNPAKLFKF